MTEIMTEFEIEIMAKRVYDRLKQITSPYLDTSSVIEALYPDHTYGTYLRIQLAVEELIYANALRAQGA